MPIVPTHARVGQLAGVNEDDGAAGTHANWKLELVPLNLPVFLILYTWKGKQEHAKAMRPRRAQHTMFLPERRHPATPEHASELGLYDRFSRELKHASNSH
jgi:hypothetical protein